MYLKDQDYREIINQTIDDIMQLKYDDPLKKWDYLKFKCSETSRKFAKRRKKSNESKLYIFERKLQRLQKELICGSQIFDFLNYNINTMKNYSRHKYVNQCHNICKDLWFLR